VGLATGLLLGVVQIFSVNPLIYAAEAYESVEIATGPLAGHADYEHSHEAWVAGDAQRTLFTVISNVLASIGFAAVMLALMSQIKASLGFSINSGKGALWGLAGYLSFFVAPGIGLPPEIPGIQAASVEHRQIWWILTVFSVAIGLGILAFTPLKMKATGLLFLALPYLVGAPLVDGSHFQHPDPAIVKALEQLHQQFIVASGLANLAFWLLMGITCAAVLNRRDIHRKY